MLAIGGGGGGNIKIPFLREFVIVMMLILVDWILIFVVMIEMFMMMKMILTWGVEGGEVPHSSAGSVAASPSLTIWYLSPWSGSWWSPSWQVSCLRSWWGCGGRYAWRSLWFFLGFSASCRGDEDGDANDCCEEIEIEWWRYWRFEKKKNYKHRYLVNDEGPCKFYSAKGDVLRRSKRKRDVRE